MFINRTHELAILNQHSRSISSGSRINIALFGLRRIGKTELLLQFKNTTHDNNILIPYINLQKIIPDIEGFVKAYSKELIYETIRQKEQADKIDIVALNSETNEILFAECKWRSSPLGRGVVEDLFEKSKLVDWRMENRREYFAVFSKSGFGKPCLEYCEEHGVLMFDANQIAGNRRE